MGDLTGKVAIVTGASRGIGQGAAIAFAEAGAAVVCAARTMDKLEETCASITKLGGKAIAVPCDVRARADIETCVARAVETFGGVDIMFNNAQIARPVFMNAATDEDMADVLNSGPFASYRFMQAVYPHMKARGGGVIVNVASGTMFIADTSGCALYNAAKCGITGLTHAASCEWQGEGIYSFTLLPEADTAMVLDVKAHAPERYAQLVAGYPKGRLGDPLEDLGRPLARLVADAKRYTGKTIRINSNGVDDFVQAPPTVHPISLEA